MVAMKCRAMLMRHVLQLIGRRQLNKTMAGIAIRTTAALEYSYWADQLRRESVSVFIQQAL